MMQSGSEMHKGHRQRMKNTFRKYKLETFEEHEVLEFILFFAIPYKDTNPIAHELIHKFGSLEKVLSAPIDKLCECEGIGKSAALFLRSYSALAERAFSDSDDTPKAIMNRDELIEKLSGIKGAYIALVMIDNSKSIFALDIQEGMTLTSPSFHANDLVVKALSANASCVKIYYNNGTLLSFPTFEDKLATGHIESLFIEAGIHLINVCALSAGKEISVLMG